ncbi:MAG: DUF748 domain-containing protein [Planctomycetes bacterium]|nr:DUF748 domain-containing protein [Planctomycetota bacterium]
MRVRSWVIRGLILTGVAAVAALAWYAHSWISPERVREQVAVALGEQFEGVDVHIGSARMRLLGGIAVTDLKLTRRGAAEPFVVIPSAVLYHDKEQLNHGRLVIRKVEMDGPTLRLERSAEGKWNVAEVSRPGTGDKPLPTFVIKNGTVIVTDRAPGALPPVTFTDVQCTLLNDPLSALSVQASGAAKGYGPVAVRGRLNRATSHLALSVEMADVALGTAGAPVAKRFAPELAPHLTKLAASASVKAELTYTPDASPQWRHKVRFEVKDARFEHPDLPWPVEKIAASIVSDNGTVRVEDATAQIGLAKVKLALETRPDAPPGAAGAATDDPLRRLEDNLQRLEISAAGVALDDGLFERLPEKLRHARKRFSPTGQVDIGYKFAREGAGWKRELEVRPKQASIVYEKFRYPLADVRGLVKRTTTHAGAESTTLDLVGTAAGQLVTLKGRVEGDGPDPAISLRVTGLNVPIDETLFAAFPPRYTASVRELRAAGRADFVAEITQQHGANLCENEFRVDIKDGKLNHTAFPYGLEKVKGRLVIRTTATDAARPLRPGEPVRVLPDRDEAVFDSFTAVHGGAPLWMHGARRPHPNGRDRTIALHIGGNNVPLDNDLRAALTVAKLDDIWATLNPRGALTFGADVEVLERAGTAGAPAPAFDPATDLKLTFSFSGPTITPKFFRYEMTDVAGWLEYKSDRLEVAHLAARHGPTRVKVAAAEVRFYPGGAVWANIGGLEMKPLIPDAALKKALPGKLGPALDELQLKGGAELNVKHMVVMQPPDEVAAAGRKPPEVQQIKGFAPPARAEAPDPVVYWDAELKLFGASLDTGVPWEDVFGSVACRGRYEGTHLGAMRGSVWLDRAVISRMPVSAARCAVKADAQQPDPARPGQFLPTTLQLLNVTGDLFRGTLGGQARVVLTDPTRYEVWVTVTDANLEEVARHYKLGSDADLKGIAQAQLLIYNKADPKTGKLAVEGTGKIDVPSGRMYNLPVLLDLVKVLKLQTPDKTAFEQAHAVFRIHGDRVKVDQIDLIGKAVCVGGSGEVDMTGEHVKFEFYTVWSQVLKQMRDTPAGDLTAFLSKNLFTIKLVRENGELKYKPEPVPLVTEPAKAVIERMKRVGARVVGK